MVHVKVYSYANNNRVWKAQIAGKYTGVDVELVETIPQTPDTLCEEFKKKSPLCKVPAADTPEGSLFESNAIARYVARYKPGTGIYPADNYRASVIDSWVDFAYNEIDQSVLPLFMQLMGFAPRNQAMIDESKKRFARAAQGLEDYLLTRTFLVGERLTLADICVACAMWFPFTKMFGPNTRALYPNLIRYFETMVNQPQFKAVTGEMVYAEADAVVPDAKKEKKPKEKKPKESKPKEKILTAAERETEEEEKEAKKPKSELDLLPPSKFVMDAWKRLYSNEKDTASIMPKLWEMYDPEGYSMYFCEYKWSDELEGPVFRVANLVGGWFQRLDPLRKYGFGSVMIFDRPEKKFSVSGCWIFRGKGIPKEMSGCDDSELYSWKEVDINNAEQRKLFEDYLCWEGDFPGAGTFNQGKIFK